jgi:hypothetical protein
MPLPEYSQPKENTRKSRKIITKQSETREQGGYEKRAGWKVEEVARKLNYSIDSFFSHEIQYS